MVSREDCVDTINKFLKQNTVGLAVTIYEYLCEIQQVDKDKLISALLANKPVMAAYVMPAIELLTIKLDIHTVTDKYRNLILVF